MNLEELLKTCTCEKKIICIVGAGGKTTLMYKIATKAANMGKKVIVSTTTHIMRPENNYAENIDDVRKLWSVGKYAVIGELDSNLEKLVFPKNELYEGVKIEADIILLEADGSKRFPCKVPAKHEPVIVNCDLVIGVMGMSALFKPLKECCFRFLEEGKWLDVSEDALLDEKIVAKILSSDKGMRKSVNGREYIVVLNQCDDEEKMKHARIIKGILKAENIKVVCCHLK